MSDIDDSNIIWVTVDPADAPTTTWFDGNHYFRKTEDGKLELIDPDASNIRIEWTEAGYYVIHTEDEQ